MKILFLFFTLAFLAVGCGNNSEDDTPLPSLDTVIQSSSSGNAISVETGRVTFINESSYEVIVHRDAFSGPVLLELGRSTETIKTVDVRTSDNYGVGTTFSIEYLYPITSDFDSESGKIHARGIDPNVQINRVIEANKNYTVQIPQPKNLTFPKAYFKILNNSDRQAELAYISNIYRQINGNLSIPPRKIGIYEMDANPSGTLYSGYSIKSVFESVLIPEFTAKNGIIYNLTYAGISVKLDSEEPLIFK
ncbi:MAG: hypothetical protein LBU89_00360 [Fibromonadaceae bacterium]|jgi:hypothetical protein|nr:hypothetical protein [Fibromonadaceae bacterium]